MLLQNFGLHFTVQVSNIEEHFPKNIPDIGHHVSMLALSKAAAIAARKKAVVIGADTVVILGRRILNKPENADDAVRMLKTLSGKTHFVYTGIAIVDSENGVSYRSYVRTAVTFRKLDQKEIRFYVKSGSPLDKAGAYGIQDDLGCTFVERINGDYFNVVGLPVVKTYLALKRILRLKI